MSRPIVRTAPVTPGAVPAAVTWAFRDRIHRVGEHRVWQGTADKGTTPVLYVDYVRYPARHVAWVLHHGTAPLGLVKADCGTPLCVHGPHLTDERSRQADQVLYAATIHGITLAGLCPSNAHDLADYGYARSDGKTGCRGCDNARRRTTTRHHEGAHA
ncbi:hypothetical protein [Streptomyces scabiei]|uniref:hypothetical protein n=1 Tax=Streptomyces scabiei TaxID=1930 RepID=UPI0029ACDD50|nr:hypothetical protein [Streptomyces scabiei]MDX3125338.1 hypothetical protein [Streptomyces scabiei]MDX3204102.1 hypothetical protein [Streptomyces scabiei]MDX3223165.1 hypothetical protein [Streptomyces scabiei]